MTAIIKIASLQIQSFDNETIIRNNAFTETFLYNNVSPRATYNKAEFCFSDKLDIFCSRHYTIQTRAN